jgi:hypothetical protein
MRDNGKNIPLKWDQMTPTEQEQYLVKAQYLIQRGYASHLSVYKLAEMLYNKDLNTKA